MASGEELERRAVEDGKERERHGHEEDGVHSQEAHLTPARIDGQRRGRELRHPGPYRPGG